MTCHNNAAPTSTIPKEERFFLAVRKTMEESYVEFFDREVWGFEPSLYVFGATREELLMELHRYYQGHLHPEEYRYILRLVMQIPWGKLYGRY